MKRLLVFLSNLLTLDRAQKYALVLMVDLVLCGVATWAAFSLRLSAFLNWNQPMVLATLITMALWTFIANVTGAYKAVFRYFGGGMMVVLARSVAVYTVPMILIFMIVTVAGVPRTISLIQPMVFFLLLVLTRYLARYLLVDVLTQSSYRGNVRNVLIYGASTAGQRLASSVRLQPSMRLRGFVDDDAKLHGKAVDGTSIYHASQLSSVIEDLGITDILLAMPAHDRAARNQLISSLEEYNVHVKILPDIGQVMRGDVSISDLRELNVEDLLDRDTVPPDMALMEKTIRGKTVMVSGAGGSIGSELCRQIVKLGPARLILFELNEFGLYSIEKEMIVQSAQMETAVKIVAILGNLTDDGLVRSTLAAYSVDTIFHAAAYKHVPLVEANPLQGIGNNVLATRSVAKAALDHGVDHFILISTDKAVRPTNIMGASKRICELILQAYANEHPDSKFAMVRFGNVLGSSGSVVPQFERQIRAGGPVTLTHRDITRYFMTIPEAAQLVIQAGAMAEGGEVYVLDMGKSVKIIDLAKAMIRLSGLTIRDMQNPHGDIEIQEIGLRPGEKLYEELLIGDNPQGTAHPGVMMANEKFLPLAELDLILDRMINNISVRDLDAVIADLRILVPEYEKEQIPESPVEV